LGVLFYYYDIKKELSFLHSKEEILLEFKIILVGMTGIRFVLCFYFPNSGYIILAKSKKENKYIYPELFIALLKKTFLITSFKINSNDQLNQVILSI